MISGLLTGRCGQGIEAVLGSAGGGGIDLHLLDAVLPAYGLFAKHVDGLTLKNIRFSCKVPDGRHVCVFDVALGLPDPEIVMPV